MKRILLILISLLTSIVIMAEGISRNAALLKAQQFMPNKQFTEGPTIPSAQAKAFKKNNAFYVFNAEGDDGFVIVSGDDRTTPILAYGEHGNLDVNQIPDNMRWWLESYVQQIEALGTTLTPAIKTTDMSKAAPITPLIQSKWNQREPYNYMCPDGNFVDYDEPGYDTNNRSVTGCVATTMAQVMYYWQWPETCPAIEGYKYTNGKAVKDLPATTFEWNTMSNTYTWGETGASANAVAKLMRYCGQAVYTSYSPGGSAAPSIYPDPQIMASIFQYSPNSYTLYRDYYSTSEWESIIYDELAAMRPVLYGGQALGKGGHQFIIDGYDGNGLFHINWGWGGSRDSYYVLSLADPYDDGSENGFQYGQDAFIGLQPAQPGEVMRPSIYSYNNPSILSKTYYRQSSNKNFEDVKLEGYIEPSCALQSESDINIEIGWAIYKSGDYIQTISSHNIVIKHDINMLYSNHCSTSFGADLPEGSYQIYQVYRFPGEMEWRRCFLQTYTLKAEVTATSLTLKMPYHKEMSFTVNSISLPEYPEVGKKMDVSVNVTNTGITSKLYVSLWLQKQGETTWTNVASTECRTENGPNADALLSFVPEEAGMFSIKITAGSDEEALKTTTVKIASTAVITLDGITYRCIPDYKRATVIRNEDADNSISEITIQPNVTASDVECKVVEIAEQAFDNYYYNVKTLIIPEGVETIGSLAFAYMSSLTKLTLPSTLKEIGEDIICGDSRLETVESRATDPINVSEKTFINYKWNSETQTSEYSNSPATLYVPIGSKAKYEAIPGWTKFAAIEEGEIKEAMIAGLRYRYATGGSMATVINDDSYTELTSVTIPATVTIGGRTYRVTSVSNHAFYYYYQNIKYLSLPEGLETIGNAAFYSIGISELLLPSTLKSIGSSAFRYCRYVKTLIIPEGVETIGGSAFEYMRGMTKLTLPSTLKEIGEYVINGTSKLETVESRAANPINVSENTFIDYKWHSETQEYEYSDSPATLYVPIGSKAMYEAIPGWTKFAAIVESEEAGNGINQIVDVDNKEKAYFDLNGREITAPQKGINIVKYSDGTTKKAMMK